MIRYWYKSQVESSIWVDITNQISKHITGSNTINNVPSEFSFQVSPYIKSGSSTINSDIKIQMDDKTLVVQDDSIVIAYGTVFDNGSDIIGWDYKLNQPHQLFNIKAEEDDFSSSPIDKFDYTDTSISSILDEIMLYTDESLNNSIGKYVLNIEDYNISFSLEKKTPRETLTELCEQIDCFWILKTSIIPDDTEIFKIYRYIEINSRSGITPDIDSDWYDGIQNRHIRDGRIENPITENRSSIPFIAGEGIPKIDPDKSMIVNYIDLSCKVYESDSNAVYTRNSPIPALPNLFNYQLDGYADDIKYLAIQIKTTILAGSTSTIVRVPSNRAANGMIQAGNKVYFPDHLDAYEESSFFEVLSVTEINTTYTEIEFNTLPFTPVAGDIFEVISNVDIYRNKDDVNYSTKGALIDCNKSSYGKIEFLPLSEPPSGQIITAIYTKCVDYTTPIKNDESIARHGLKYKEIKIDDSIVLTRSEVQNLSSKLLQLNPVYKFSIPTRRYGIVPIGLAISVKITNYITETFILNENSFEFLGAVDRNKKDAFVQNLVFSTQIGRPDKVIEKLQKLKKSTSSNASKLNQSNQKETLKIQDYITWSFNQLSGIEEPDWTPDAPTFTSITVNDADSFTFTYPLQTGVNVYRIDVATDSGFTNKISGYNNKGIFRYGTWTVNGLLESGATTVYLRMRALSYDNIYSDYSETQAVVLAETTEERILFMRGTDSSVNYTGNLYSCKLDGSDLQQHTTTSRVYIGATFIKNGDIVYSRSNGSQYKLYIIKKSENYLIETELKDSSNISLSFNNLQLKASKTLNKIAYYKENPPYTTDLYLYDLDSKIETQLEGEGNRYYLPYWNNDSTYIYAMTINVGDIASNSYIKKIKLSDGSISTVVNNHKPSLFPVVDTNEEFLFYAYNSSSTYSDDVDRIRRYKLDGSEDIDIVTTGTTTYYAMGIDSNSNEIYFCNKRSPHNTKFQLYKSNIDGTSQALVFGSTVSYNDYFMDLKEIAL